MKRGQITIIMIVCILILIIYGTVTYMNSSAQREKTEVAIQQQALSQAKIQPLQEYVMSCLDLAAKAALETMGKQGGNLYLSQGGLVADQSTVDLGKSYLDYEGFNIPFAVMRPRGIAANFFYADLPQYPWETFPWVVIPDAVAVKQEEGFFGFNYLNKLMRPFSNSVQEQMEVYVSNNVLACVDWSTFELQNLEIVTQNITTNITITERDVIFDMVYPIRVTDLATTATGDLSDFTLSYPVRLKQIFEFLEYLSDKDVTDLLFQVKDATLPQLRTDVIRNVQGTHDDIVVIRDAQSTILGQPFEFRFAAQNRAPALGSLTVDNGTLADEVSNFVLCGAIGENSFKAPTITLTDTQLIVDNPAECSSYGDQLVMPIAVYDPDDDPLTVVFDKKVGEKELTNYVVKQNEVGGQGITFAITVRVMDGEFTDYQDLIFDTALVTP